MMTEARTGERDTTTAPDETLSTTTGGVDDAGGDGSTTGGGSDRSATDGAPPPTAAPLPTAAPPPTAAPAPSTDSRNLAVAAHLSALIALAGVPSFIGPLAVWLLSRDRDPWVADQARDALNFNLSLLIYAGGALALTVLTVGLGLLVVVPAAVVAAAGWLVVTVLAAIRAADGERYHYPLTLQLIS